MDTLGGSDGESGDEATRQELAERQRGGEGDGEREADAPAPAGDAPAASDGAGGAEGAKVAAQGPAAGAADAGAAGEEAGSSSDESGGKVLKKKKVAGLRKGGQKVKKIRRKKKQGGDDGASSGASSSSSSSSGSSSSGSGSSSSGSSSSSSSSDDSSDEEGGKKKGKKIVRKKGAAKALKKPGKRIQKKGKLVKGGKAQAKRKRNAGEDSFIDNADDNMEAVREYDRQKEHTSDEEDPYKDDENLHADDDENGAKLDAGKKKEEEEEDENDGSFRSVLKRMAKRRNKSRKKTSSGAGGEDTGPDNTALFREMEDLIYRMKTAYYEDRDARARLKPAVSKLKLLDDIEIKLRPTDARTVFVERGGLPVLRQWLEPNKVDQALPAQALRSRVIELLPTLNIEEADLRESGIGKVVNYLRQHPKEIQSNKRILTKLMEQWSRAIFHRGIGHNIRRADTALDDPEEDTKARTRSPSPSRPSAEAVAAAAAKREASIATSRRGLSDLASTTRKDRLRLAVEAERAKSEKTFSRARVPQAVNAEFKVQPRHSVHLSSSDKKLYTKPSDKRIEMEKALAKRRRLTKKAL